MIGLAPVVFDRPLLDPRCTMKPARLAACVMLTPVERLPLPLLAALPNQDLDKLFWRIDHNVVAGFNLMGVPRRICLQLTKSRGV